MMESVLSFSVLNSIGFIEHCFSSFKLLLRLGLAPQSVPKLGIGFSVLSSVWLMKWSLTVRAENPEKGSPACAILPSYGCVSRYTF